jgi:bifunctional non-homologous end joining protein LigD
MSPTEVAIDGRRLRLTNLDKVMYPATGFTKGEVVDYYARVADVMLPHLAGRPLTLVRHPDGVGGPHFFEKNCPGHRPAWVPTVAFGGGRSGREVRYCLCEERATLVWLANLAALELHALLARAPDLDRPTAVVFDLDPGPPAGLVECCRVALRLRELLEALGLRAFPKTSGGKGLHVLVPVARVHTYADTRTFAHALTRLLARDTGGFVVDTMDREVRRGRVFIDWSQNHPTKTTVAPYSLRARERPFASAPVTWDEVAATAAAGDPSALAFDATDVLGRVERHGDLLAPVLALEQHLPATEGR